MKMFQFSLSRYKVPVKLIRLLTIIVLMQLSPIIVSAQQVPNGDMESWNNTFMPEYPDFWLLNAFYISLPCTPLVVTATKTSDANSGNWAAKLEAKSCFGPGGVPLVYIGYLFSADIMNPNFGGIPYNQRPAQLNFYYKFLRMGTDTGFAKIILRHDSAGFNGPIIGEGEVSIINNASAYTPVTVPINYLLPDTPTMLQITFATSKTIAEISLSTVPGNGANIGTTLWIDDITVSGGTLNTNEVSRGNGWRLAPNPINDISIFYFENYRQENFTLNLFNTKGELVKTINKILTNQVTIHKGNLVSGLYFFTLFSQQQVARGKIIIQ